MCMRSVRAVLLLLLLPAAAFAQIQSGSIVVKTTDEQGAVIPGATLTVSSPALPADVSGVTDASGVFHVPGLPLGTYTVKVALQGFKTIIREDIVVRQGQAANVDITAAGHAHIDVAWLWPLAQTRRKAGRTFHNALRLMDEFSDFSFTQSQPQLYDYVRSDYPDLFESIKKRVAEGRWEPIGGMWVEADCNITGAEALVRQFVLGRTFFREQFGVDSPILWLPDVFGYA